MKAEAVTKALTDLGEPWGVRVRSRKMQTLHSSDWEWRVSALLTFPDKSCTTLYIDRPLNMLDQASVTGFFVVQLKARGLRRLVHSGHLSDDTDVYVVIVDGPTCKAEGVGWGQAATELEALTQACLALPALSAAAQGR